MYRSDELLKSLRIQLSLESNPLSKADYRNSLKSCADLEKFCKVPISLSSLEILNYWFGTRKTIHLLYIASAHDRKLATRAALRQQESCETFTELFAS